MKGHPILGVITGFLFGLFLGVTLFLYGVIPLSSDWIWILPLLGLVLGLIMAAWAPFGKGPGPAPVLETGTETSASGERTADVEGDVSPASDANDEAKTE